MTRRTAAFASLALLAALGAGCGSLPSGGGDDAVDAYGAYRRALASRDRGALRSLLAEERAGEVDDPFAPYRQYSEARSLPSTVTVLSVDRSGDGAEIRLRAGGAVLLRRGEKTPPFPPVEEAVNPFPEGTVRMVRQGGTWRLASESWSRSGPAAVPAVPFLKGGALPAVAATLPAHVEEVTGGAFAGGGRVVTAGYADRTLRLWDENTGTPLAVMLEEEGIRSLVVAPDGRTVVTASEGGRVSVREIVPGGFTPPSPLPGNAGRRPQLAVNGDGTLLAAASLDGKVSLWNLPGRRPLVELPTGLPMRSVAFSPGGPLLAAGSARNAFFLWDLAAGKGRKITVPKVKEESDLSGVAFRPDGALLAVSHVDGTVTLWDVATQEEKGRLVVPSSATWAVAFSPDGAHLVTANQGSGLHLRDGATGAQVGLLSGHGLSPRLLAFRPDGAKLLSGGAGGEVLLWQ